MICNVAHIDDRGGFLSQVLFLMVMVLDVTVRRNGFPPDFAWVTDGWMPND